MMLRPDQEKQLNEKLYVGYDLNDRFSQISFVKEGSQEAETVSTTPGAEQFNIPTCLCKRFGAGQWFFGREALKRAKNGEGVLIDHLVSLAYEGQPVTVDHEEYDPIALLTLYVRRSLTLLTMQHPGTPEILMITCSNFDSRMVQVLQEVTAGLVLKKTRVMFQNYTESIFEYNIHQPENLWNYQTIVFELEEGPLTSYRMECNHHTKPVVAFIEKQEHRQVLGIVDWPDDPAYRRTIEENLDNDFLRACEELCHERVVSSVYLIGDGFRQEWMKASLQFLCRGRHVFKGSNLYSKGAAYAAADKVRAADEEKKIVFLGEEKCKSNIGIPVTRRGAGSYLALIDAGQNWYEAEKECDLILETGNTLTFTITPLTGSKPWQAEMVLDGLPDRPRMTTRLHLVIAMTSPSKVRIQVQDLGFGEIFQATMRRWMEELDVGEKEQL
ncbi:MAG: hypothetical protein K6A92_11295 [Lachnospiraceae bacterium]|nr:hypothetical protein [Lachnospiraceae bacterium]